MDAKRRRILRSFPGEVGGAEVFALLDAMDERDRLAARVARLEATLRGPVAAALGDYLEFVEEGPLDEILDEARMVRLDVAVAAVGLRE